MTRRPPDTEDRALVDLVLHEGNERAFRALYRRHTPYVYQFALRTLGGSEQDADDVIQETWIRAVEGFGRFRWESSLRSWLAGIALNLCRGLFRRKDRGWVEIRDEVPASEAAPRPEHRIDLERALQRIPDGYRTVLVLHDVEGYKHAEIAEMMGTTEGTSKSQLFHARRAVRALLAGHERSGAQDHA